MLIAGENLRSNDLISHARRLILAARSEIASRSPEEQMRAQPFFNGAEYAIFISKLLLGSGQAAVASRVLDSGLAVIDDVLFEKLDGGPKVPCASPQPW